MYRAPPSTSCHSAFSAQFGFTSYRGRCPGLFSSRGMMVCFLLQRHSRPGRAYRYSIHRNPRREKRNVFARFVGRHNISFERFSVDVGIAQDHLPPVRLSKLRCDGEPPDGIFHGVDHPALDRQFPLGRGLPFRDSSCLPFRKEATSMSLLTSS